MTWAAPTNVFAGATSAAPIKFFVGEALSAAPATCFHAKKIQIQIHNLRCDYIIHIIEHIIFTSHKQHNAYIQIHNVHKRHNPYIQSPQTTNQNI